VKNLNGRDHFGDKSIDGRIILKWVLNKVGCGNVDWSQVAQNRV
jgi:hypothetical protein